MTGGGAPVGGMEYITGCVPKNRSYRKESILTEL